MNDNALRAALHPGRLALDLRAFAFPEGPRVLLTIVDLVLWNSIPQASIRMVLRMKYYLLLWK